MLKVITPLSFPKCAWKSTNEMEKMQASRSSMEEPESDSKQVQWTVKPNTQLRRSINRAFAQVRFARDLVEEVVPVPAAEEYDRTPNINIMANKMAKSTGELDEEMVEVCQA
jgi:hypothetical protein